MKTTHKLTVSFIGNSNRFVAIDIVSLIDSKTYHIEYDIPKKITAAYKVDFRKKGFVDSAFDLMSLIKDVKEMGFCNQDCISPTLRRMVFNFARFNTMQTVVFYEDPDCSKELPEEWLKLLEENPGKKLLYAKSAELEQF